MTLAEVWFVLIAVLWVGFLVLEGFDFGVGALHGVLGRDEAGRETALGTIAPVWDGNEVWLVVAGAGMFAAFPGWYATMFSAMYLALILLLVALILRGVAIVLRGKQEGPGWRRRWSAALIAGSVLAPLLIGIALGNLLRGLPIGSDQEFTGSFWDLLQPYALYTGLTVVVLCLLHAAAFVGLKTVGPVHDRADRTGRMLGPLAAAVVVGFAAWTLATASPGAGGWIVALVAVAAVLVAAVAIGRGRDGLAFGATAVTTAAVVGSIFVNLYPRVMVSTTGPADDLTIQNTSSAHYSLTVMTWVAGVLLPVVLIYQGWTYHVFRRRLGAPVAATPTAQIPSPRPAAEQPAGKHRTDPGRTHARDH
ncbi:cytochrome d ubiquinol oxidase subunit II [Petropleomorpha daqingensis]|uniref:Cytochrome d ubiquinol oxidase subunit II n=1 Tax=Petropleomorpha daqingensis TaxID=2026353 RepID=A0A853CM53_9ACTN|nr:cytochrome d ubiquinol oxidase subunit II [Petropleomorpha daqingensis]NYJ08261.1 cytochrome d ubiquinol oxidase subunit II [Petropleomorpha daqingensis]